MFIAERAQPGTAEHESEPDDGPRRRNRFDALDREGVEKAERERRPARPEEDPIRLYFGEMGRVQLLTAAQEVEIGRRIEAGQLALRRALGGLPVAVRQLAEAGDELRRGERRAEDVIVLPEGGELDEKALAPILRRLARLRVPIAEEFVLGETLVDTSVVSPVDALLSEDVPREVEQTLSTLTPRERDILRLRFGLGGEEPHTLEEVGARFGLTRERIRQIEMKALAKLRGSPPGRRIPARG